ncbi:MAG TPA: MraY family glycosyltransferase [Phycisphaerae bacterium]|nr:MraY family glycosyltransferase [Phycisphaerae bacterium]
MAALILLSIVVPCIIGLLATVAVRAWARRRGFVDQPGGHKQHDYPVALGGGIAVMFAVWLPLLAATLFAAACADRSLPDWMPQLMQTHAEGIAARLPRLLIILGGALVLHILGLIDDSRPLAAAPKFAVQFIVALAVAVLAHVRLLEALPAPVSVALTVLWIVLITNAFNFLDNMDGLSAGVAVIASGIFAASALLAGQLFVPVMALVLAGALLGFLPFNFAPARIYLGDAGSMVIGYMLALLPVLTTFYDPDQGLRPFGVLVPLVVLAVPLYDVFSVCWHRRRAGASIFRGDRRHFSHRLVQRGMSVRAAVLTIYLATATTAMSALTLPHATWPYACVIFAQCLCVVLIIALLEHAKA